MNYRMVIKGCEALSMLVKACPLPVGGKGRCEIVFYETVTGHIKHWAENGPFKFESATVFEENGTVPLCQLTDIELSDFKIIPSPADAVDLVLYAPTISWADAVRCPAVKCSPPSSLSSLKAGRGSQTAATLTAIFSTVEGGKMDVVAVQNEIVRLGESLEGVKLELRLDVRVGWVSPFDDQEKAQ